MPAFILLVAILVWYWGPLQEKALAKAAHGARIACSCRYVAGRDLDQCRGDLALEEWPFLLTDDAADSSVSAWVPLLARQTATYDEAQGCKLEPWQD